MLVGMNTTNPNSCSNECGVCTLQVRRAWEVETARREGSNKAGELEQVGATSLVLVWC